MLLLDVQMPGVDGLDAMAQLAATAPPTRVLMLTTFDLDEYVYRAMRAGASGFLLKDMPGEDIVTAVRQVARGADALLAPALTRRLVDRFAADRPRPARPPWTASPLASSTCCGWSPAACPTPRSPPSSFIGETTVKTHVARVLMKLGLRDRVQAVVAAHEAGLTRGTMGS